MKKEIIIPCQCAGGSRECGFLKIFNYGGDNFEFCWVKKRTTKRPKIGIYIFGKGLTRLRKFLIFKDKKE